MMLLVAGLWVRIHTHSDNFKNDSTFRKFTSRTDIHMQVDYLDVAPDFHVH